MKKTPASIPAQIFLDIDGVIGDFEKHMHAHGKAKADGSPKWEELDMEWWKSMPAFEGARTFYEELRAIAPVRFLTAPIPKTDSFGGKAEWVQSFLPERGRFALLDLIICRAVDKPLLARPHHILIDDRIKNITEWEEAGGIGIHHTGDYAETLKKLKEALDARPHLVHSVPQAKKSFPPKPKS